MPETVYFADLVQKTDPVLYDALALALPGFGILFGNNVTHLWGSEEWRAITSTRYRR